MKGLEKKNDDPEIDEFFEANAMKIVEFGFATYEESVEALKLHANNLEQAFEYMLNKFA